MKINKEILKSSGFIFIAYIAAGCLCIMIFRLIFPGEASPLPVFAGHWRSVRSLLEIITLFPALALSALAVPFGLAGDDDGYTKFSPQLFQRLMSPVITAIVAAAIYALLFFLALPLAQNSEEDMRFKGELYRMAKTQAQKHGNAREWVEASQFIGICDSVWKDSPELDDLRADVDIHLDEMNFSKDKTPERPAASVSALPGQREPLDAAEAIMLGETALGEGRPMDAHWLATLAGRIAGEGSIEEAEAARLAARAWNLLESQQPDNRESRAYSLNQMKMSGYQAMVSDDWIRAFYIFQELSGLIPNDPDVRNYLAAAENGTQEIAFFMDEMNVSPGDTLTGVIFSLPVYRNKGRSVLRMSSMSAADDYAYGTGLEYMVFDSDARLLLSLKSQYAKILPITLDDRHQVLVRMRILDRNDPSRRWEPEWEAWDSDVYHPGTAQITLDISYETFLMLSEMHPSEGNGLAGMSISELFAAVAIAGETGHITQVFQAEILNRLGVCLFFLPIAILTITIGWQLRARLRARYFFALSLPVLPLVFNGLAHLYRAGINIIGISLVLAAGFSAALTLFIVITALTLVLSLIVLASQHG